MKKITYFILSALGLFTAQQTFAVCPVCVVAVGAGVGLSRWLGVDDTIAGLWIGAITVAVSMWTINWFNKKNIKFKGRDIITILAYFAMVIIPLSWSEVTGHPFNRILGIDKLMLGILVGSIGFIVGEIWYEQIKKKNNGHAQFPFQKVVMPVAPIIVFSFIFYLITR